MGRIVKEMVANGGHVSKVDMHSRSEYFFRQSCCWPPAGLVHAQRYTDPTRWRPRFPTPQAVVEHMLELAG